MEKFSHHYQEIPSNSSYCSDLSFNLRCIPRKHTEYYYSGRKDELGLREKEGCNEIKTEQSREIYAGNFVFDNQHGRSVYKWIRDEGSSLYEGYIYCNQIEGYGRFSYPDASVYEGLFRNNRRFGPGIYTEPSGRQNVGTWKNQKIIKLCVKVDTGVPRLACTHQGKLKAEKFKNVLQVNQKYHDKAKDILTEMNAPLHIMENSDNLYNKLVKDSRSPLFHWCPYEEKFSPKPVEKNLQKVVQNIIQQNEKKFRKFKKKGKTNKWKNLMDDMEKRRLSAQSLLKDTKHLVAWNNSPIMKEILLFCFKYVNQEDVITYNVADIMKNERQQFRTPGTHETLCVRFLKKCQMGEHSRVHDYLAFKNIDPNVSDAEGNTGLITAAANDQHSVIDTLLDQGADINKCNDEGFTPLGLSVTRYFTLINNVTDWETEFLNSELPNIEEAAYPDNTLKWRHSGYDSQSYIRFPGEDLFSTSDKQAVSKEIEAHDDIDEEETIIKISEVKETILKLIKRGADPSKCNIPIPVLSMAIKCRDEEIITNILEAQAKIGFTEQDALALQDALFTAIQLPADDTMVSICSILLKYGANPNAQTQISQEDENLLKICPLTDEERGMKSVLHALVTRKDGVLYNEHLDAVVKLLISHGAKPEAILLGHTPLSAAILSGNVGMIESLLKTLQVDPNQKLAKELGVPFTVLMDPLCFQNLGLADSKNIADTLVKYGANLLTDLEVGSFTGNIIEYSHKMLEKFRRQSRRDKQERTGGIREYTIFMDYIAKLAQQALIDKVKENLAKRYTKGSNRWFNKDSTTSTKRRKQEIGSQLPGIPNWINKDDMVHILNHIQEQENKRLSRDEASIGLQAVIPTDTKFDDKQRLKGYMSLIKGPDESNDQSSKHQSRRTSQKLLNKLQRRETRNALEHSISLLGSKTNVAQVNNDNRKSKTEHAKKLKACSACGRKFNQDILRLCPVCKKKQFCSSECFWQARKNNTHTCEGDIFPDWKEGPGKSENDKKNKHQDHKKLHRKSNMEGGAVKKSSGTTRDDKPIGTRTTRLKIQSDKRQKGLEDPIKQASRKEFGEKIGIDQIPRNDFNKFPPHNGLMKKQSTNNFFPKVSFNDDFKEVEENIPLLTPEKRSSVRKCHRAQGDGRDDFKSQYSKEQFFPKQDNMNQLVQGKGCEMKIQKFLNKI